MLDWLSVESVHVSTGGHLGRHPMIKIMSPEAPLKFYLCTTCVVLDNMSGCGAILVRDAPTGDLALGHHLTDQGSYK
jgi:hypothetical protein